MLPLLPPAWTHPPFRLSGAEGVISVTDPAPPADAVSYSFPMTNQIWTLSIYPTSE